MIRLPDRVQSVLARMAISGERNDQREQERSRKMLNLEWPTAELLHLLLVASERNRVLEIGTSNGFSTIWIAAALSRIPGAERLTTIELDSSKLQQANNNYGETGLLHPVDFLQGDATLVIPALAGPLDCIFFDADRISAKAQLDLLLPKLADDVILLCDNVLSHPGETAAYLDAVQALPDFCSVTVPIGKGLHIGHRRRRSPA